MTVQCPGRVPDEVADNGAAGCEGFCAGVQQKAANFVGTNGTAEVVTLFEQGDAHTGCGGVRRSPEGPPPMTMTVGAFSLRVAHCVLGRSGGTDHAVRYGAWWWPMVVLTGLSAVELPRGVTERGG